MIGMERLVALLPWIGGGVIALGLVVVPYEIGQRHGEASIRLEWAAQDKKNREALDRIKADYAERESANRTEIGRITHDLAEAQKAHALALADQRAGYERRLRNSDTRAALYQRQAAAGPAQCRDLGRHAARLDRALEDGRRVVGDLRRTLDLRDEQLRSLGQQLTADRALIEPVAATPTTDSPR